MKIFLAWKLHRRLYRITYIAIALARFIIFLPEGCVTQIQLKSLAEEMQAIVKGLEKVELELTASESDGPVSEVFRKVWPSIAVQHPSYL